MGTFLSLLPPNEARELLLSRVVPLADRMEEVNILEGTGRISAEEIFAEHPLPVFPRSTVDGFAVRAKDTYGAGESMPAYLKLVGEIPMGSKPTRNIQTGEALKIHTGGMLPDGSDAIVMLEYVQDSRSGEIEILRPVAPGENVIAIGEDVAKGQLVLPKGVRIRPAEIGGLAAFGIARLRVANKVKVGIISSGDEVVNISADIQIGQVRDINSYTLAALINSSGGDPVLYGIVPDNLDDLFLIAGKALHECDVVVITAGSSASTRDMTAKVIDQLGKPGVLVHGINTRPGKPTILGLCNNKAVIGLPGNPVSALINGILFVVPLIEKLSGLQLKKPRPVVPAHLGVNVASQAGREDWQPVKLIPRGDGWLAEPIFGKSNLIFTLASADGLICIHPDSTGLEANELVEVYLI
jgi:molybdopterin molybdotransferase